MKGRATGLLLLLLLAAPSAHAAQWKPVTTPDGASTDQVGLARTADGALHVAWHHRTGPNTEDLLHTLITPAGEVGSAAPIQAGWANLTNPALVSDPGGLRVFWGGIRTTDPSETNVETNTALSPDGGSTWALQSGSVVPVGAQSYASNMAATVRGDGSTLQAFAGTLGTWVHAGLTPATPNHDYQAPLGQYGYDPNLATDAKFTTILAWYSSAAGHLGVQTQYVGFDGSPADAPVTMPGTGDLQLGMLGRTPLTARAGGGFYVAYPVARTVRLWRVGASSATTLWRGDEANVPAVAVAAAGDGRLWIAWARNSRDILVRRSNQSATKWGAVVDAGHPKDVAQAYTLDASAAGGALDVLGNFNIGTSTQASTAYRRVLPGLTLTARRAKRKVHYEVTDAGDPVKGAEVTAGRRSGTTDAAGHVTLTTKARHAKATHPGYSGTQV